MAKAKSSASSATRKKHAAKQAKKHNAGQGDADADEAQPVTPGKQKPQRGQKKQKKDRFAPKVKSYVPPPPPPKGAPDPVDLYLVSQGKQIDPELVVVLRRLAKKDEATIGKGVEGFEAAVREVLRRETDREGEDWERELKEEEIIECMAVWAHHFPRLALHPSRRLRLAVHSLHSVLVSSASPLLKYTRSALLSPQWTDQSNYVGAWCVAAFDSDRTVRGQAQSSWSSVVLPLEAASANGDETVEGISLVEQAEPVTKFAFSLILAPPASDGPTSDAPEDPAFVRTSAVTALVHLLQRLPTPLPLEDGTVETLLSEEMWDLVTVRDQERTGEREQPKMVRRAMYELLGAVAGRQEDLLVLPASKNKEAEEEDDEEEDGSDERLRTISRIVLDNCWAEEEGWPGIIGFLRRYPQAWELADMALDETRSASVSGDEADETEDAPVFTASPTLTRLLTHLSLACSAHPVGLYPTILLLLSTIPTSILPTSGPDASTALSLLFEHFYAAYSSRAISIGGPQASEAWLGALLECLVFEMSKVDDSQVSQDLSKEWFGRAWSAFLGNGEETRTRGLATRRTAEEVEKALTRFASRDDHATFEGVWEHVEGQADEVFSRETLRAQSLDALAMALKAFLRSSSPTVVGKANRLAGVVIKRTITAVQQGKDEDRDDLLKFLLSTKDLAKDDAEVVQVLDDLAVQHLPAFITTSTHALSLLMAHLAATSTESRSVIWQSLFAVSPSPIVFLRLVDAVRDANLAGSLPNAGLDDEVRKMAKAVLANQGSHSSDRVEILRKLMLEPEPFVDSALPNELVEMAVAALSGCATPALSSSSSPTSTSLSPLVAATALLANYAHVPENAAVLADNDAASTSLFQVAYVLPNCRLPAHVAGEAIAAAQQAWHQIARAGGDEVVKKVLGKLKEQLVDAQARPSAIEVVQACASLLADSTQSRCTLADLLPSPDAYATLYDRLALSEPASSLSIIEPVVVPTDASPRPAPSVVDSASLASYPRAILAFLDVASRDHSFARRSLWLLPHLLLLTHAAKDQLALASRPVGLFGTDVPDEVLERLIGASEGASSYLLSSAANALPDGWHASAVTHLRSKEAQATEDRLLNVLDGVARQARETGAKAGYAQRSVATILSAALRYSEAGVQDAERWLAFAQNLTSAPGLACAIIHSIKPILAETPRYERYENELAANLAGVPSTQLETKGLPILRQLLAAAPPPDAPIIFLPQQRTMFLIQAIQKWVGSDDGLPEDANAGVVELLSHLVAIVQDLSGSHWDLVFDLIESNLDAADLEDEAALPAIYQSCLLLAQMKELARANAELRSVTKGRIDAALALVLQLFVARPISTTRNAPRAELVATMARLIKDLPPKLLSMDKSFDQLLRLLQDPLFSVQVSSHDLLRRVIGQHVEDLVVEAELDVEEKLQIELPASLIELLGRKVDVDGEGLGSNASTYLLAWLTTFAFFGPASPRIRSAYIEQLRNADLVASSLLPSLFGLLNLSDRTRPTDLAPWSIDEFLLELVDALDGSTLPVFAAHVYYRALQTLPSLIRAYWASLQNVQLSRTIQTFTSRNFSPLLIASELYSLRDPASETGKQLRDNDDFTVKVAAGANEVKCVFVVDEESMEIGIKVPSEFPLVGVEVKDVRKVGVTDKQWRAWLLAMQQVITTQSAAIADALLLFKRNVTLHFEGVESCAICYSTVSTVDRSLPSKTCKTCANKFHAGCLYKWFQTSHGSSCPLCRQIM